MAEGSNKYFIQQYSQQEYQHGGIGYVDAEKILLSMGYVPVLFPYHTDFSLRAKFGRFLYLVKLLSQIKRGSVVVFLFPVYAKMNRMLLRFLSKKKIKIICFVTDINGLKDGDKKLLEKETRFFRRFRYFIVHNEKMKQWLEEQVPGACAVTIEFFDFLTNTVTMVNSFSFDIVFAGNLEKSPFIEQLHLLEPSSPSLRFHLYGPGSTAAMIQQKNVKWFGVERPYDLPLKLKGAFGLLWDGETIEKPGGSLGDYMQYISHHKLSLYIISRLPIIVPATAASAPLIEKYRIGFSVNSLYDIEGKIKAMARQDYLRMQDNMVQLARKISRGGCLREALERLENEK
jgi:hypothetical protein